MIICISFLKEGTSRYLLLSLTDPFAAKISQKQISTKFPTFIFVKFWKNK